MHAKREGALAALLLTIALSPACRCGEEGLVEGRPRLVLDAAPLEFGTVPEGRPEVARLVLRNDGGAPLHAAAAFAAGASPDFSLPSAEAVVPAGGEAALEVRFLPAGAGEDAAVLVLTTDDPDAPEVRVDVHGGPIAPRLRLDPEPVDFAPFADGAARTVALLNDGLARLTVTDLAVDPAANPAFSLGPTALPQTIAPGEAVEVTVTYARSLDADEGRLVVHSDDPDAPTVGALLPDPFHACGNGLDDDGDGLTDYPDDPGCADLEDTDEADPPECVDGYQSLCGTDEGRCTEGARTCEGGAWGPCRGAIPPADETCNAVDDDCDGATDEDGVCTPCTPDAVWRLASPSRVTYQCCGTMVDVDVGAFTFSSSGARIQPSPSFPAALSGAAATCPDGGFDASASLTGSCTETYRLAGAFTGADTWAGTLTLTFTGSQCDCFGGTLGSPCTDQSFAVTATRGP